MFQYTNYRPQAKFRKVMFLHMSVCPQRGGIPACIADGIPACLAAALQGVVSQHALQVSRPTPQGEVGGLARGGVSRPRTRGGGLQAHTKGSGLQAHTWGVYPSMHWGRHPTPMTATAAGGTHPTGMHSCFKWEIMREPIRQCNRYLFIIT